MYFQITTNKMQHLVIYLFLRMLYMFQAVPPPILRSTKLYTQLQVLSTNTVACSFLDLFISTDPLHVSGSSSAHHQEHKTVHTASGIVNQYCCLLIS